MSKEFAIIGGDARISYLAKMLSKSNDKVYVYGQNEHIIEEQKSSKLYENLKELIFCNTLEEAVKSAEIIISSIPFSKDGINIYSPFSKEQIKIESLIQKLKNKTLFAGSISKEIAEQLEVNNVKVVDLMKQEDLTILNTIATAEGAISDIILNTETNIHGSKILILGFGRVAKVLAKKLAGLDAKVTCAARKEKDFAWMEALGFEKTNINNLGENLKKFDIIINTVPQMILEKNRLNNVKQDCLLLDLASKPGGIDQQACKELDLKFIWALAIPGKVAPITSAKYIKETIEKIIKEGADN
ncbi:MAG: dipicolinate synthase subunit DpsA [Clostridia bacterium]|nr:dipicolinate synthase subunit DpsA [Clostridia bacterium]